MAGMLPRRHVLVIGPDGERIARLVPVLKREEFQLVTVPPGEAVVHLVRGTPFELVVISYPGEGLELEPLLGALRERESACRGSGVILLAAEGFEEEAARYLDRGVNRVVGAGWTEAHIWRAIRDLLEVAPRAALRSLVHAEVEISGESEADICEATDVSVTGMRVRAARAYPVGARLKLVFRLPDDPAPIEAAAEVVRATDREREGFVGFAVRFVGLAGRDAERIRAYVASGGGDG